MQKRLTLPLVVFICACFSSPLAAQQTDVVIIGVIHTENKFRTTDILLNILKKEKPDVLLAETDTASGYFKDQFTLVEPPTWYKAARKMGLGRKMSPEMDILYQYREYDSAIKIHPFDHTMPNRKKFVKNQNTFEQQWTADLNKAHEKKEIPDKLLSQHETFIQFNNYLHDLYEEGYVMINRPAVTDSLRKLMQLEYDHVLPLMQTVPGLKKHASQFLDQDTYWKLRNEIMAQNILRFISIYKGRKIVVLTGILHKYYLEDLLSKYQASNNFQLSNLKTN